MARDISRKRSEIGASSNKNAPKITDSNQQNVIDSIYRELNQLRRSINSSSKLTASTPVEGKSGDIRLYTETANDGSKGYFLQGKFGGSWASGRLSLDELAPKRIKSDGTPSTVQSYESDGGGYITKDDVTYETLDSNNDVGVGNTQVAKGSHVHDHNSANILNTGTNTHDQIDDHIEDLSIHREPNDNVAHIGVVTNQTGSTGTREKWARSDHQHVLDQSRTYDFTAEQKISVGTGNQALTITGDVDITGNLTVDFAEAGTGDTTVEADLSVGKDVVLNNDATNLSGNVNNTNTTTIHGVATSYNKFIIDYQPSSGNSHLELKYDSSNTSKLFTGSTGNFTLEPTSDIILSPTSGNVIPKGNLEVDLGTDVRKWRSLFIGELVADHLVAQNVMATIGGKILVAPTTTLMEDFPSNNSISIKLKHNDPNFRNAFIYLQKADFSNGTVQYEVIQTADAAPAQTTNSDGETCYLYVITARNKDSSGINSWTKNDAVVSLYSKGTGGNKGFIELTSSGSIFNNTGPRITAYAASDSDTAWDAAKPIFSIGRIGGYGGVPTNDDTAGLVIGDNLTAGPSDTTNPFKGLVAQRTGMKLFNTPIKMYDGDKLNVLIDRDANGKNVFAIGPEVDESDYSGSSLLFSYVNNAYTLSIDGNIDLSENVDFTIDEDDIMNSIDHFLPTTDMGNVSQRGLYLTPGWLGFWETTSGGYWPVKIGATASGTTGDPFFEIKNHPASPTEFIKYTTDDGLEIAGKVTIIGEQPPITLASTPNMNVDVSSGVNKPSIIYQLPSEATTIYIHVKVENAVNGKIEWTNNVMDEPAPNWSQTVLSNINGSGWFTGEISNSGSSNYRAFRYVNIQADTNHFVKGFVVTKYRPGDPQAIIDSTNSPDTFYQNASPVGSFSIGDQWFDTDDGNNLYVWNGTEWEPTFTAIDGGSITTGTLKGIGVESTSTFNDDQGNEIPRTKLDLGGDNSLKQYAAGNNPVQFTKLDGGTLTYVHQSQSGGVVNDNTPLEYPLPTAQQVISASEINVGSFNTFANMNATDMFNTSYEVIPIPATVTVTGQQTFNDLNTTNGIAREEVEYSVTNKSTNGFTMNAVIRRGTNVAVGYNQNPTNEDLADTVQGNGQMADLSNSTNGYWNGSDGLAISNSMLTSFNTFPTNQGVFIKGLTNTNCIGGANRFLLEWRVPYRSIMYYVPGDGSPGPGGNASYPGFPGTTRWFWLVKISSADGNNHGSDMFTAGPSGSGATVIDNDLLVAKTNSSAGGFSTDGPDSTWPGSNQWSNEDSYIINTTISSPNDALIVNPLIEVFCYATHREKNGTEPGGNIAFESPRNTPGNQSDNSTSFDEFKMGQVPATVETLSGIGKVGALVWTNSSGS